MEDRVDEVEYYGEAEMKARLPKGMITIRRFYLKHGYRLSFSYQTLYRRLMEWKDAGLIKLSRFGKVYIIFNENNALELWHQMLTPVEIPPTNQAIVPVDPLDDDGQLTLL